MKFLSILLIMMTFSCGNDKNKDEDDINLTINSNYEKDGNLFVKLEIDNNTKEKIYFPIVINEMIIPYHNTRNQNTHPINNLYYQGFILLVYDSKGNIISSVYGPPQSYSENLKEQNTVDKIDSNNYDYYLSENKFEKNNSDEIVFLKNKRPNQIFKFNRIKNESFFVESNSKIIINTKSHLTHSSALAGLLLDDLSFYPINKIKQGKEFALVLNIDSVKVKESLTQNFIDSLHRNNIRIFHGTIYSNKVLLKYEE